MFSVYCEQCGSVLLLGPANIVSVQNTSQGIVVHFTCHAGHRGVWLASAYSDHPVLPSRAREHAPLFATASATGGWASALPRRPAEARAQSTAPAVSRFGSKGRASWARAPWRRGGQPCGDSA